MTDFSEIYIQYFEDVYKYALLLCKNKTIAEDITQETFFKAVKGIDTFNRRCRLYVWLCQIAKNTYFSYCKKEKRFDLDANMGDVLSEHSFEQKLLSEESAFEIHKVLHKLDEPYKEVFTLRLFGELSFARIAQLFGKTESWARVTYHRAKLRIKGELE